MWFNKRTQIISDFSEKMRKKMIHFKEARIISDRREVEKRNNTNF